MAYLSNSTTDKIVKILERTEYSHSQTLEKSSKENICVYHILKQTETNVCTDSIWFSYSSSHNVFYRHRDEV